MILRLSEIKFTTLFPVEINVYKIIIFRVRHAASADAGMMLRL